MDHKNSDFILFNTPSKTDNTSCIENSSFPNESFHDVQDKNAFFQTSKIFDIDNRESLMLLKNLDDIDLTRNSLGLGKEYEGLRRQSICLGRESLGILEMNVIEEKLNESNNVSTILNRAVLYSNSHMIPFSSNSSCNSLKSPISVMFNSHDHMDVFSHTEDNENVSNNLLKMACVNLKNTNDKIRECKKVRRRTQSSTATFVAQEGRKEEISKILFKSQSVEQHLDFTFENKDDNFADSLYMEARMLATKIGDNSIFEENGEACGLDFMLQPDWVDENIEEGTKEDTMISKYMLETPQIETKENSKNIVEVKSQEDKKLRNNSNSSNEDESQTTCDKVNVSNNASLNTSKQSETVENLSKIFQNKSLSTSRISCSSNKSSKDAKEILENLSVILSCDNPTSEQKSEGQNLLHSLADILYSSGSLSKRESSDDSGHSSTENDQDGNNASPQILNLRYNPTEEKKEKPVDLSLNRKKGSLTRSMSCPDSNKKPANIPQVLKTCRVNIPGNLKNFSKLKPKKSEDKKRGPLKAILPLGNMSKVFNKQKVNCTTPKNDGTSSGNKKISTPTIEPKLRPVAQSTPDDTSNKQKKTQMSPSHLPKPKFNCPVSPLARPSNTKETDSNVKGLQRTLTDSSLNKTKNPTPSSISRRKSSSDIKVQPQTQLKRSNSMNKEVKPLVPKSTDNGNKKGSSLLEKNCLKKPVLKSLNLVSKIRRSAGKENLPQ